MLSTCADGLARCLAELDGHLPGAWALMLTRQKQGGGHLPRSGRLPGTLRYKLTATKSTIFFTFNVSIYIYLLIHVRNAKTKCRHQSCHEALSHEAMTIAFTFVPGAAFIIE